MRSEIEIVRARNEDLPRIAEIARESLHEPWSEAGLASEAAQPHGRLLVARDETSGRVLGYLVAHRIADEVHVLSLAVSPRARRRGVGARLLDAVLAQQGGERVRVAHLEVRESAAAARALYARRGFVAIGRRRRYYANGEDAITMRLDLDAVPPGAADADAAGPGAR